MVFLISWRNAPEPLRSVPGDSLVFTRAILPYLQLRQWEMIFERWKHTMMRKEEKTAIIEQYATHPGDTGSPRSRSLS